MGPCFESVKIVLSNILKCNKQVNQVRNGSHLDRHSKSESTLELLSRVASSVEIRHHYNGPNTGRNSGGWQRRKKSRKTENVSITQVMKYNLNNKMFCRDI